MLRIIAFDRGFADVGCCDCATSVQCKLVVTGILEADVHEKYSRLGFYRLIRQARLLRQYIGSTACVPRGEIGPGGVSVRFG
jgi:hypothetical protein